MKYHYQFGATRWFRFTGDGDVRLHRPPKGWDAEAVMLDSHPHHRQGIQAGPVVDQRNLLQRLNQPAPNLGHF